MDEEFQKQWSEVLPQLLDVLEPSGLTPVSVWLLARKHISMADYQLIGNKVTYRIPTLVLYS